MPRDPKSLEVNTDLSALPLALLNAVNDMSLQLQNEKLEEDKLSQLPDELLVSILSLMSYKEAARTSVLSCRWEKLWTLIPILDLEASSTLSYIEQQQWEDRKELVEVERPKYVNCVNSVLDSFQGSTIEELRVRFDLDLDYSNHIQRWVNFAFEKKVQRLVMDLRHYSGGIPNKLCRFIPTLGIPMSTSLRIVQFAFVAISGEVVGYMLSTCCSLEHLSVRYSDILDDVKVDIPLLHLKYLEVTHCMKIRSMDISAPNLLTLRYLGPKFLIPFEKIPKVTQVYIAGPYSGYILYHNPSLSNHFTQLETLELEILQIERPAQFPKLSRLKILELGITYLKESDNLLFFTPLIKSSPWLKTFKMKLSIDKPNYGRRSNLKGKKCRLKNLKLVEIIGFRGCSIDNAFISYLIENSVMLEKFIIDPRERFSIGIPNETQAGRDKATQLKHKFPALEDKILVL